MSGVDFTAIMLLAILLVLLLFTAYFLVKIVVKLRASKARGGAADKVDFVVDTFHKLVTRLKDKERELEDLRSMAEQRADIIEDYNENILQSVPSGVVSMDREWRVVKANLSALGVLGLRAEDMIGRDGRDLFPREFLAGRKERGEAQFTSPGGNRLWLGYSLAPLLDGAGNTIGQLLVFTDLTGLKALEAQAELRKRLSSLGEMAAGIAHELRNPMAVISGYMRLLGKKVDAPLQPTVDAVNREVAVMDRIIGDFLSFARPAEPVLEEVDLAALIEDCARGLRDSLGGITFTCSSEPALRVSADPVLLRQAVFNLIQNARESVPEGGSVSVACARQDDRAVITVTDNGHGIPEDIRDKVFLPFYTTKENGTGLGLAIVHRIVTEHGGGVDLKSSPSGTSMSIWLPLGRA